ncbi:HYC_CC_PP family protein [Membranihabitans marinus]|uniref:HYC_CC_PP family protein n=1 Tax=Membranihabitans marinus TaxID=1227546 RepID=UPI001F29DA15|nr:hypothetical protein [Membranihabitans marinus]
MILQKIASIALLSIYVFVSSGIQGVVYFCSDEWVSIKIFSEIEDELCTVMPCCTDSEDSCEESDDSEEDCCVEEIFSLDYAAERVVSSPSTFSEFVAVDNAIFIEKISLLTVPEINNFGTVLKYPPDGMPPLYIKHHSLVFYG